MQIAVNIKNRFAIWYFMFPDGVGRTNTFWGTKILQKSGIQKNEVIELIYRGFI